MTTCNYYPKFEANQVLTADQMNQLTGFLESQERLTRRLFGAGIFCGLEISYSASPAVKINISKGCGITTGGYLITSDDAELTRYRPYKDPGNYELFGNADSQILLWELLPAIIEGEDETISDLTDVFLNGKAVILYLEIQDVDLETCTSDNCNEKGRRIEFCVKYLLIKLADLQVIIGKCIQLKPGADLAAAVNAKYRLPAVSVKRETELAQKYKYYAYTDLQKYYSELIEPSLKEIQNAVEESYNRFKPLLADRFNDPFHDFNLAALYKKTIESNPYGFQYFYDFLKDLVLAYNEFKTAAFDLTSSCLYNETCFPLHLMLGEAKGYAGCEPSVYRQIFIQAPLYNGQSRLYEKTLMLFERLVIMTSSFLIPGAENSGIKITPSNEKRTVLSERAIPYYYQTKGNYILHHFWNYELNRKCEQQFNLSYNSFRYTEKLPASIKDPLSYDGYDYPFYRIEGHLLTDCGKAFDFINGELNKYNLPVKLLKLKIGREADSQLVNLNCRFEDLELMYDSIKTEFLCFLKNEIEFFAGLDYEAQPGGTELPGTLNGTVKTKSGEAIPGINIIVTAVGAGGKQFGVVSDVNGNFRISNLDKGVYEIVVSYTGFNLYKQQVSIETGKTVNINIVLEPVVNPGKGTVVETSGGIIKGISTQNLAKGDFLKLATGKTFSGTSVGNMYLDYAAGGVKTDILTFINSYWKNVIGKVNIDWGIIVGQYVYPFNIVGAIENLVGSIADNLKDFNINIVQSKSDALAADAKNFSDKIYADLKDPKYQQTGRESEILLHLSDLIGKCTLSNFKMVEDTYRKRAAEIQKLTLFSYYISNHPGVEHKAGVYSGGTFILVYDDKEIVVADFALPFICCSDCPPVTFISATPVTFKLPKNKFCLNDNTEYNFILEPPGGEVKGPGVTKADAAGGYSFNPSKAQEGDINFTYNVDLNTYNLLITVIDIKANFVYTFSKPVTGNKEREVRFTSSPTDADSYSWNFGDGQTSSQINPVHKYNLSDQQEFEVSLKVTKGECTGSATQKLLIPYCSAVFTYVIEKIADGTAVIQFTSEMTDADTFSWTFGDGTASSENDPVHKFDLSKLSVFEVSLTVAKGNCKDTTSQKVSLTPCTALFVYELGKKSATTIDVFFHARTPDAEKYVWDFGDGTDSVNLPELTHTYILKDGGQEIPASLQIFKGVCSDNHREVIVLPPAEKISISLPQTVFCKNDEKKYPFTITGPAGKLAGPGVVQEGNNYYFVPVSSNVQAGIVAFTYNTAEGQSIQYTVRVYGPVSGFKYEIKRTSEISFVITFTNISTGAKNFVWRMEGNIFEMSAALTLTFKASKPGEKHEISLTAIIENCSNTFTEIIVLPDMPLPQPVGTVKVTTGNVAAVFQPGSGFSDKSTGAISMNTDAINNLNLLAGFDSALTANVTAYRDTKKYFIALDDDLNNSAIKKLYLNGSKNNEIADQYTNLLSQTFNKITKYEGKDAAANMQFTYNLFLLQISQLVNLLSIQTSDITADSSLIRVFKSILTYIENFKKIKVDINPDNQLSSVLNSAIESSAGKPLLQAMFNNISKASIG